VLHNERGADDLRHGNIRSFKDLLWADQLMRVPASSPTEDALRFFVLTTKSWCSPGLGLLELLGAGDHEHLQTKKTNNQAKQTKCWRTGKIWAGTGPQS
jgi:hypothetical protein